MNSRLDLRNIEKARVDPPYDRRASFKEGVGRVLWFRQTASIATTSAFATTPATQKPGTSKKTSGQKEGGMLQPQQSSSVLFKIIKVKDYLFFVLNFICMLK